MGTDEGAGYAFVLNLRHMAGDGLSERFETRAFAKLLNYHESAAEGAAKYYVGVLALSRTPLQTVTGFIARFLREPARFAVSDDYIEALLSSGQFTNALTAVEAVPVSACEKNALYPSKGGV